MIALLDREVDAMVEAPARSGLELSVSITGEDIAEGVCRDPLLCAAARGIRRAIREAGYPVRFVSTSGANMTVVRADLKGPPLLQDLVRIPLPPEVAMLVRAFDGREHVEPLSFVVTIPGEALT